MTSATNEDDVLSDSQLDTVVGGHKSGPSNYNRRMQHYRCHSRARTRRRYWRRCLGEMMAEQPKAQGSKGQGHC